MNERNKITDITTQRLRDLIEQIDDSEVREVVRKAMNVEIQFRSSDGERFPFNQLRQIVENAIKAKALNTDNEE